MLRAKPYAPAGDGTDILVRARERVIEHLTPCINPSRVSSVASRGVSVFPPVGGVIRQTVRSWSENNAIISRAGKKADTIRGESAPTFYTRARILMLLVYRGCVSATNRRDNERAAPKRKTALSRSKRIPSARYYSDISLDPRCS